MNYTIIYKNNQPVPKPLNPMQVFKALANKRPVYSSLKKCTQAITQGKTITQQLKQVKSRINP